MKAGGSTVSRLLKAAASSCDPRVYLHALRLLHYVNYSHVSPRRAATIGKGARLAPNVSIANGERVSIGAGARIGARCHLWAGNSHGRVVIGDKALLAPEVFLTASNYRHGEAGPVMDQDTDEADVVIGDGVWLGARVMVLAGVHIGAGTVVGAGSVVTRSLPAGVVAVGAPARVTGRRPNPTRDIEPATAERSG